jgi:hypothetical protein
LIHIEGCESEFLIVKKEGKKNKEKPTIHVYVKTDQRSYRASCNRAIYLNQINSYFQLYKWCTGSNSD